MVMGLPSIVINFMNDFNNIEMLYFKKNLLQISAKLEIISNLLYELTYNPNSQLIGTAVKIELEAILDNILNAALSMNGPYRRP